MSSTSFRKDLAAYVSSRFAIASIAVLWLVLSACALLLSPALSFTSAIFSTGLMAVLITQFRLWDDLVDRHVDVVNHPQRTLVNTSHIQRFNLLCGGLCVPAIVALSYSNKTHGLVYGLLLISMAIFYAVADKLPRLIRAHLVLLKYPIFIWLCAWNATTTDSLRYGMVIYFGLCIYEIISDSELHIGKIWAWLMAIEAIACAALLII